MEDIGGLPDHIQVVVVGVAVLLSTIWGVIKFINPYFDHLNKKPVASSTDAVVISAALADSRVIADLKHSIDRLCELEERSNEAREKANIINTMLLEAITRLVLKP